MTLILKNRLGMVRSIDIVNEMGFAKPSVSVGMKHLREGGFITMDSDGYITLTISWVLLILLKKDYLVDEQRKINIAPKEWRYTLKTRIAELRKTAKISQAELAQAIGVTRQTITSLECEKHTASLLLAYKIARYFGVTIEEIFDFTDLSSKNKNQPPL